MDRDLNYIFQLDDCLDWIIGKKLKRIVIQLAKDELKYSTDIIDYLKNAYQKRENDLSDFRANDELDMYATQTNTCCVDLLVVQHVTNVDAIIHFGEVCLTKPTLKNSTVENIPILFVFCRARVTDEKIKDDIKAIRAQIDTIIQVVENCRLFVLYDTNLIDYAKSLDENLAQDNLSDHVEVANLCSPCSYWYTTAKNEAKFIREHNTEGTHFGHFIIKQPLDDYNCTLYLGTRLSIQLSLQAPRQLYKINCYENLVLDKVNYNRLLNRRIALVERLREEEELRVGVILTNPLPDISEVINRLETYSKARKHTLYFISMVQTIDDCKVGNFDLCDAFVIINSCTCSTILESLVFNRPILTDLEFKLACGFSSEYGRVTWPGSSNHPSPVDLINKRKVSDVSLALVHTRNKLLERCSQARANKWSGLEYGSSSQVGVQETLAVEQGLRGIASVYVSEPMKKHGVIIGEVGKVIGAPTKSSPTHISVSECDLDNNGGSET